MQQTIMIVDDTRTNRMLLASLLAEDNRQIVVCENGQQALDKVHQETPDLILLDIVMPGIDGIEVCRILKADLNTQHIPIIFITSLSQSADEEQGLNVGAVDYISKPFAPAIVSARVRNHLELCRLTRQMKELNQELSLLATTDSLTGAYNRRFFIDALSSECSRSARYGSEFSVIMVDIDHFKKINDSRGHNIGDMAIKIFYDVIQDCLRTNDILARLGGDEFAAILTNIQPGDVMHLATRLCSRIRQLEIGFDGLDSITLTASIGIVSYNQKNNSVETILNNVDIALYQAKERGRDQAVVFESLD